MSYPKPACFSNTDAKETDSIVFLKSLFDSNLVRSDNLKTRDTTPNYDGSIHLTDKTGLPLGKLDVQVKTLPENQTKYSCPIELFAYSSITTLPLLLICSDPIGKRAFWKHIYLTSPLCSGKYDQKTITIQFSNEDEINKDNNLYYEHWLKIVREYQSKVSDLGTPPTNGESSPLLGHNISKRLYYHGLLSSINMLMDQDFKVFKEILYPGTQSFGIAIYKSSQDKTAHGYFRIPCGTRSPSLVDLKEPLNFRDLLFHEKNKQRVIIAKERPIGDPQKEGLEFALGRVFFTLKNHRLKISGIMSATEIIMAFIKRYSHLLGLASVQPEIELSAFEQSLFRLIMALQKYTHSCPQGFSPSVNLDRLPQNFIEISNRITSSSGNHPVVIESKPLPIDAVFSALEFLREKDQKKLTLPWSIPCIDGDHGILKEDEKKNFQIQIRALFECLLPEYKETILAHGFDPKISKYFQDDQKIVIHVWQKPHPAIKNSYMLLTSIRAMKSPGDTSMTPEFHFGEPSEGDSGIIPQEVLWGHSGLLLWMEDETPLVRFIYTQMMKDLKDFYPCSPSL